MNNTTILKKAEGLLLWIYNRITNKFTSLYSKLKELFPVLNRYPLLKYGVIPLLIALFFTLRYILKFVINELATWASGFAEETSGYVIAESTIVLGIAVLFIILRIGFKLMSGKKENNNESTPKSYTNRLRHENTKALRCTKSTLTTN